MQTTLLNLMADRLSNAFGWMLLHSLWQGLLLGLSVGVTRSVTKNWNATARYNIASGMFTGFLLVCLLTFIWHLNQDTAAASVSASFGVYVIPGYFNSWFAAHENNILLVWLVIFFIRLTQMAVAIWYNRQMLHRRVNLPETQWQQVFQQLCKALNIQRTVTLLESACIKIPVVTGHLKPFVLLPFGLLSSLTADQTEAILLHELAHIRRNDWLVNLFQHIAASIFFFHPAVALVNAWIKEEREHCCDDIAIGQTRNKTSMVEALIHFKEHNLYAVACETAFPGKKNQLLRRVQYIVGHKNTAPNFSVRLFYLTLFVILFAGSAICMMNNGHLKPVKKLTSVNAATPAIIDQPLPINAIPFATKKLKAIRKKAANYIKNEQLEATAREEFAADLQEQAIKDQAVAKINQAQAITDEQRAKNAQAKALLDQQAARLMEEKARQDQQQAKHDQENAMKNQAQAILQQEKAEKDQQQAKADQEHALIDKKEAERPMHKSRPAI